MGDGWRDPAEALAGYERRLVGLPLSERTRREYARWVRLYCGWLRDGIDERAVGADPLADPRARDYAARDFKRFLKSERMLGPASVNLALAAVDHLYRHLGMDRANVRRERLPRLADLTDRRLYLLGQPDPLIAAEQLLTHRIHVELILEQWDELLRIAGSIKRGWIVPSVLISRLATDPKPDRTARALREYGRLIETNFILRWAGDPPLRQRSHAQLNKGENANALRRALGYGNRGRVRARDPEQIHRQLEARRLGANAIHYWNTRYIALSLAHLERLGIELPDGEIAGVHNAHHEHINLIGHHDINLRAGPRHGHHRPLHLPAELDTLLKRAATNKTATNA